MTQRDLLDRFQKEFVPQEFPIKVVRLEIGEMSDIAEHFRKSAVFGAWAPVKLVLVWENATEPIELTGDYRSCYRPRNKSLLFGEYFEDKFYIYIDDMFFPRGIYFEDLLNKFFLMISQEIDSELRGVTPGVLKFKSLPGC